MRRFILILFTLLLAALPALAEESLILNDDVLLMQSANNALIDRYGLTLPALGLFNAELKRCGDTAIVTYASNGSIDESLAGEYFVIISPNGTQTLWTHDDVDPALWQSGDLNSPAWGVKQLTAYLDEHPYERADFCAPYVQEFTPFDMDAFIAAGGSVEEASKENRTAKYAARDLAITAVQAMYSLTDEETARLTGAIDMIELYHYPNGHSKWQVMLQDDDILDPIAYYVTIDAESSVILEVLISSGGVG